MNGGFDGPRALAVGILCLVLALFALRIGLGLSPRDGARTNRALLIQVHGETERALDELERVAERRPRDVGAMLRQARALRELERLEDSREVLNAAIALDPRSARLKYELAKTLASAGAFADADSALGDVLEQKPDHADATLLQAGVAAAQGEVGRSIALLELARLRGIKRLVRVRRDALFDPIRHDPRFAAALRNAETPNLFREGRP